MVSAYICSAWCKLSQEPLRHASNLCGPFLCNRASCCVPVAPLKGPLHMINIAAAEGGSSGVALGGTPDECVSVGPSSPAPQLTSFQLHISELPSSPAPSFPAPSSQLPSPPAPQPHSHMTCRTLCSIWRFFWCCGIGGEHVFKPTPSKTNATAPKKTPNRA